MKQQDCISCSKANVIEIFIGQKCPNNCVFCSDFNERSLADKIAIKDVHTLKAKLEKLATPHTIRFTGFEPTCNSEIIPLIKEACKHSENVSIVSNGYKMRDLAYLENLLKAGISEICISVHGRNSAVHDKLSARSGAFSETLQTLQNIQKLREQGHEFGFSLKLVLVKQNLDDLLGIINFMTSFKPDSIAILASKFVGKAFDNADELLFRYSELIELLNNFDLGEIQKNIRILYLPTCIMQKLPPALVGYQEPVSKATAIETELLSNTEDGVMHGKICVQCAARFECLGVQKKYLDRYGWDEFVALDSSSFMHFKAHVKEAQDQKPELFISRQKIMELIKPFDSKEIGGWKLDDVQIEYHLARLTFKRRDSLTVALKLMSLDSFASSMRSQNYAICFDGKKVQKSAKKFWNTILKVIVKNDK